MTNPQTPEPTPAVERAVARFTAHGVPPSTATAAAIDALTAALETECHEAVSDEYDTEEQPCSQPAVAYRRDDEGEPYPVCEEHATDLIPLTTAILGGAQ